MGDLGGEAGGGAEREDAVEERRGQLAFAQDEPLGGERGDGNGTAGEGMIARQRHDDRVAVEVFGAEGAVEGRLERTG